MAVRTPHSDELRDALERAIGFQYNILGLLGRGGMGAVYHAHEKALDRPVAIKVLPPDAVGGDARERFLREARTAARLTHPNIVPLFTFGETQGLVYYVMGYVDGESLEQRLRRGPLDSEPARNLLTQLATALDYAHQQGIVHRDVKPDNVLIERGSGVAKLTDFGIAKRSTGGETLTGTGLLMGTPKYMSPEQAAGDRELDARSDIYALGLVGYAVLAGRPPFDGGSVQEILTQQVTREAPSLRKMLPDLESAFVTSIERALRKDPVERWSSAGDMANALTEDESAVAPPASFSATPRPGTYALLNASILFVTLNLLWLAGMKTENVVLPWMFPVLLIGFFFDYARMRWREKKSPAEIKRTFTEPPRWWRLWWPSSWRRKDDVWHRLPTTLRNARFASTYGIGAGILAFELIFVALSLGMSPVRTLPFVLMGLALPLLWVPIYVVLRNIWRLWRWGKQQGIPYTQAEMLGVASTAHPQLWKQSWAARFLSPAGTAASPSDPTTPQALAEAIVRLLPQLPAPLRQHAGAAPDAARALVQAIDALDTQIATHARSFDQSEVDRLESRVAALGGARAGEPDGQREMRQLYSSQLDLLKRLARQSQELSAQRARYLDLLRTLWRQLTALQAEHTVEDIRIQDLTARIRHIAESLGNQPGRGDDLSDVPRGVLGGVKQ